MNNLTTKYSSYEDAILDISVYTKLLGKNMYSLDELRRFYFEEFKITHKKPSLLNKRYELSRLVSDDYRIRYIKELELRANETLVNLQQTNSNSRPNLDIPDSAYVSSDIKFTFSYENKTPVSDIDDLIQRYNIRTGEALDKGITEVTNLIGSVKLDQNLEVEDEEEMKEVQNTQEQQDSSFEDQNFSFEEETIFNSEESTEDSDEDEADEIDEDEVDEDEVDEDEIEYEEDETDEDEIEYDEDGADEIDEDEIDEDEIDEDEDEIDEDEIDEDEMEEDYADEEPTEEPAKEFEKDVGSKAQVELSQTDTVSVKQEVIQSGKEQGVLSSPVQSQEPTDIRAFLRKYTKCDIEFLEQYFTKKQINDALKIGKIIKKGNKIRLP